MRAVGLLLFACVQTASISTYAQDLECRPPEEYVSHLGLRYSVAKSFRDQSVEPFSFVTPDYAVRYVRVRLRLLDDQGDWHLTIRDRDARPLEMLGPAHFAAVDQSRWTTRLFADYLYFDLISRTGSQSRRLIADEVVVMPEQVANPYYSVQDPNAIRFHDLYADDVPGALRRLGDSVVFLMMTAGTDTWSCSGFVVGKDLVLTNWHCGGTTGFSGEQYWNDGVCRNALIDLSWDGDNVSSEFACQAVVATHRDLDYALLRIAGINHDKVPRPVVIDPTAAPASGRNIISVVHHPLGRIKQVTESCSIASATYPGWTQDPLYDGTRLTHDCDTEGGSSGAPIFNLRREVIAVHHAGFERDPQNCRATDRVNKAVLITEILDSLDDGLRTEILNETRGNAPR